MKRIKNVLLITIFIFLIGITFNVKAESFNYYLSNSAQNYEYVDRNSNKAINLKRGDTILITAILDNKNTDGNYKLNSGKLTVRWDDKFLSLEEINGKVYNDSISDVAGLTIGSVSKSNSKVTLSDISSTGLLINGKNKLVEFKFVVIESSNSGTTKVYQMDGEDSLKCLDSTETINCGESQYSELKYNITKSTVNKLSMIKLDGQELEAFSENNNTYDIEVDSDVTKIKIEAIKKDNKSVVTGDTGDKLLDYGLNKFKINVISESGVSNTYVINVTREDSRSNDNTLKTLTISSGEITFKPSVTEYTINVENEVEKIKITSSLNDTKAKYVTDYKNKEVELVEGSNKIEIRVLSEKGEEKTYTLNINRALSSNNSLKSLMVNDEKIKLLENEFIYNITVENEVDEVVIKAVTNDTRATVKLDEKYLLEVGENEINIKVVAASGKEASYIINVTRKKILSKDSLLTSLKVKGYSLDFKQDVTTYDLKIKDNEEELEITTTQEDPNATVEIEGNKNLVDGSIVKINVKAEDGTFTRYFIRIEKGSSGIPIIIIIIIILLILLGGCIGLIIYRKKKAEKEEFEKLDSDDNTEIIDDTSDNNTLDKEEYVGAHEAEEKKVLETEYDDKEKDV